MDPLKKKRFLWGVLLAWAPWLPTIIGLGVAFRGIAAEKATGLAVVAGGLAETVLLVRAFEPGRWLRSLFLVFSLCLSGLMLLLFGVFLWLSWFQMHRPM